MMPVAAESPEEPTVRGVVVLGLLDWVRREHEEVGIAQVIAGLPAECSDRYAGPRPKIIGTTRIPGSELAALAAKIIELWGQAAYCEAAAHVAVSDLTGYMRLFLKVGTPGFVLRRLPRVLSHYCSEGELIIEELERNSATLELRGVEGYGQGIAVGAIGWIRAALDISGAQGLSIETKVSKNGRRYFLCWH